MSEQFVQDNCCNVLGCRNQIAEMTDVTKQLRKYIELVFKHEADFIAEMLSEYVLDTNSINHFYMASERCLVSRESRALGEETTTIKTSDFLVWCSRYE